MAITIAWGTIFAFNELLRFSREVKQSLPVGVKPGVARYYWGGKQSIKLSQEAATKGGSTALFEVHYTAHPSGCKMPNDFVASIQKFNVLLNLAFGDDDSAVPKNQVDALEVALRDRFGNDGKAYELKVYPNGTHGFAVRADRPVKDQDEAADQAVKQAVAWSQKFL